MPAKKKAAATLIVPAVIQAGPREDGLIKYFDYQDESITAPWRFTADEWARQTGKTFKGSSQCLLTCCTVRRAMCVTMSASLRQGELVIRKDAEVWRDVMTRMRKRYGQDSKLAENDKLLIQSPADDDKGKLLDIDAIADLFSAGRLSAKVRWGPAADDYALHQIFAANPETARGATGDFLFWDEALLTPDFRECMRALRSMANRRPKARFNLASSPPISSAHESWEQFYNEDVFPVNPRGNWRMGKAGPGEKTIRIHRVDAYDAEAAGIKSYDELGKPISIVQMREESDDKDGFDREALLVYRSLGGVLIPYSCLVRAQRDGRDAGGLALDLGSISELNSLTDEGLKTELRRRVPLLWAASVKPMMEVGLGYDQASSDKTGTSNPSALVLTQAAGIYRHMRLCLRWLSRWPRVNEALLAMVIADAKAAGCRLKGLAIDASNETLNARRLADLFSPSLSVGLYKSGEKHPTAGTNWKEHLGDAYAKQHVDGLYTLPPGPENRSNDWLLQDHSLAVKANGKINNLTSRGYHGDTFDAAKLAEEILSAGAGPLEVSTADMGSVASRTRRENYEGEDGFLIGNDDNAGGGNSFS